MDIAGKKSPAERVLVMLGGSCGIGCAETSFSNSRLTACQSTFTCTYVYYEGDLLVNSLL